MTTVLERLPRGAPVAVIRLRSLGDSVLTTPVLALLKQARPDLRIAVVVEDRFAAVFEDNPDVDAILRPSLAAIRRWRPALALNVHGGNRSAVLTGLSGARFRAGFAHFRYPGAYNVRIPRAQQILGVERVVHTAEHLASAAFYLGAKPSPVPRASLFARDAELPPVPLPNAVIHPFASQPDKTWPAQRFVEVAQHLERTLKLAPVFIGGPSDDLAPFAAFPTFSALPLRAVKALLSRASLFFGNDSGPAHMAAAFGVPLAVIFGSSNVDVWRPWTPAASAPSQVLHHESGIESIRTEDALEALSRLGVHA